MPYVVTDACVDVNDKSCRKQCPVDCIYEGDRMLYIHPDECVDCGACLPACPVQAIFYDEDLPAQSRHFAEVNAEFFTGLGSPGGAKRVGPLGRDHALVAALPATAAHDAS
ncbi:ferredoxin [Micromonospora inositola]|uniref:Ferredoxin n=1 Tax=Micromonospora inositola TaxID=47865 RepID=A0A1C5K571_9ACTN|nr:ferredoxin [Micromonospora inositola]SCG77905.1 ferredoxin [Micromonospora inositola]